MRRMMNMGVIALASFFALALVPSAFAYGGCSSYSSLQGTFGFTLTGTRNGAPRAAVGQMTFDGRGGLAGSETQSNNGTIVTGVTETGTFTINSNCSGSASVTLKGTGVDTTTRTFNFQILHNSDEIFAIVTDTGFTETIDFKQAD